MARTVRVGIPLVLLLGACACATTGGSSNVSPPRASLGSVGIVSVGSTPAASFPNSGFLSGAAKGAGDWVSFFGSGNGGFASLGFVFFPIAGIVGGIEAETTGLSGKDRTAIEAMFQKLRSDPGPQNILRERLRAHAATDAKEMWLDLGTVGEKGSPGTNVANVLEVVVQQIAVTSQSGEDPYISIQITVAGRLQRVSDRRILWSNDQLVRNIGTRRLSALQANDDALLKSAVTDALDVLARDIVVAVFPDEGTLAEAGSE